MQAHKEAIVREFLALFHATPLDMPRIRAAFADDARWQPVVPIARIIEGAEAICGEIARQYTLYTDCSCDIFHIAVGGDTVFTEREDRVRMLHDGRTVVTRVTGIFDLDADGRILFWREYWDMLDIAGQIGVTGEQMLGMMDVSVPA